MAMDQGDEHRRTIDEVLKYLRWRQDCGYLELCRITLEGACLLSGRRMVNLTDKEMDILLRQLNMLRLSFPRRWESRKTLDAGSSPA